MERIEEFIEALKEKGIRIWSDNEKLRYQAAKGAMDSQTLEKIKEKKVEILEFLNNKSDIEVVFKSNQAERYEPFPLTNIQNSYVIGRNSAYELGDVTCHGYIEITYQEELDKEKLEMAWNKVIAKHDMLRAIIYENGYQRVQKDVPEVKIESYDLRTCSEDEQLLNLQNIRANYAEKQYPLGQWPMCDIVLSLWKGKSIIHFSLDMLITDFMSANLILNDLDNYYHGKAVEVKVETLYRDIVLYNQRKSMSKSKERKKAERYWQDKIRNMGTAPELIINNQKTGERETFKQLKFFIDEEGKENINEIAKELRVTASTVILTAFGEVINKWSKNSKFSINMTMLSRDKTIPGVDKVVGDFTDVNVYSMDYSSCKSFESRILENQVSLWEDLQNNAVSGIEVLRELGREKKENVMIPIVYTSTLGVSDSDNSFLSRSNISYKISQTPQVWIDCQIAEENGGVAVNWDYRTGVFLQNVIRDMFEAWVKYNIFDINKDIMEQTIAPFSVDIILAANVLHNAKNIHYVLENLKKLLKPNGTIIILEETLEAYTLLTSMEFKDGLTGFTDERAENNQTFFKREQWEGVFKEHKADIVYQFPEKGTPLEMAGQTIYVVRFKENYICPDKNNMLDELERRIPEYMIPSVITFLPRLPQTSNDKIDRGRISKWISASAEENKKVDVAELPQNDLEEQIARIWCKELNIERIGRNDNFYLSGGDSLLIAQVIARMRETIEAAKRWSWDDLLKEMMKTPTIRGVAKILSNQAGENEQDKSLVIIKEAAESSEKKVTVVFHAGTGTLTPYNSLIAYITERSQENEAVMGFTFGDEAEYLAIPTDKIFENLGKKYGRILSELGFTEYTLIGHCVGGLIALETAHYLKDKGKNVSSVTLLSTSIPHKKEETVLADLDMKIFETAVQTSLYNELLLERTFASLIDADIKKAGHQVDNDTLQQVIEYLIFNNGGNITVQALCSLTGKFAEVGAEFQRLHSMSATERMNDLYTTIERPNGQLMEHQRKMLNVLFRVFAQNFRCVSSYIPKVYTGKMRVFDCESAIANFFPSLFSEDKKTWEQYAQGEFLFDTMKGDHISCMNSPYIEENVKKILDL